MVGIPSGKNAALSAPQGYYSFTYQSQAKDAPGKNPTK